MCGIAGYVSAAPVTDDELSPRRMTDAIAHRGPDDAGYYSDEHARLGHRRLSIIDLAAGHQPMTNEDSSLWIVYNGEIFNHSAIRPRLEAAGHRYGSHCDTETIVHAYEEFGPSCVELFRGMFAFAIWDKQPGGCSAHGTDWEKSLLLFLERSAVRIRFRDQSSAGASGNLGRVRERGSARISRVRLPQ